MELSRQLILLMPSPKLCAWLLALTGAWLPYSLVLAQERAAEPGNDVRITSDLKREGDFYLISATAELPVSRGLAWVVLTDYEGYADFIPEVDSSRIVSRTANGVVLDQKGRMSFLFFSQPVDVRLAVIETPPVQVASRSLSGNLRDFSGRYALTETPGGVRIEYSARFVPEFDLPPLLGTIVVRNVMERNFAAMLKEMQRRAALRAPAGRTPLSAVPNQGPISQLRGYSPQTPLLQGPFREF